MDFGCWKNYDNLEFGVRQILCLFAHRGKETGSVKHRRAEADERRHYKIDQFIQNKVITIIREELAYLQGIRAFRQASKVVSEATEYRKKSATDGYLI